MILAPINFTQSIIATYKRWIIKSILQLLEYKITEMSDYVFRFSITCLIQYLMVMKM